MKNFTVVYEAKKIAIEDLRSNYGDLGIYAGPSKHHQYWARDSFIASFGSCSLGDFEQVKRNLNTFSRHQREDGHIPARIEENYHVLSVVGINLRRKRFKVLHKQSQPWATDVIDSNAWFIIASYNYVLISGDRSWPRDNIQSLVKAGKWLSSKIDGKSLIREGFTANWLDCNFRRGNIASSNILVCEAFFLLDKLLPQRVGKKYLALSSKLKDLINKYFWDGKKGYFIDYIDPRGYQHSEFASDGNLFSIWFGIADETQSRKILNFIDRNSLDDIPMPSIFPRLVWWDHLLNLFIFPAYKTKNSYTWIGCLLPLARMAIKDKRAFSNINRIAKTILKYKTCHEILASDGKPVNIIFYKSEKQIAWTAGLFVYVLDQIEKKRLKN